MTISSNHDSCIVDVVAELLEKKYRCYLECEIQLSEQRKAIVDIYAIKPNEEVLIEVGYLSQKYKGERLLLLRKARPQAKIHHITQLKNFLTQDDWISAYMQHKFRKVEEEDETIV